MKHLDWYMTMKKTSDKRNAKYYAALKRKIRLLGIDTTLVLRFEER